MENKLFNKKIVLVLVVIVLSLILVGSYSIVNNLSTPDAPIENIPPGPQIQVLSPQENTTYNTGDIPLNITANNVTAKITYFLEVDGNHTYISDNSYIKLNMYGIRVWDGDFNITYTESTEFHNLYGGVHTLTVYAFDADGNVGDCQIITFSVVYPVPPEITLTRQELQSTISYFKSQGLTIVPPDPKATYLLHGPIVNFENAKEFALAVRANNRITEVIEFDYPEHVSFCAYFYTPDHQFLPVVYSFGVTIV